MDSSSRCDKCDQEFTRAATLRRHVQTVHQKNRLTCEDCAKTFSRKDLLERHRNSHRGSGKLPCSICSRPFRSDYLAEHRDICSRATRRRCAKIQATIGTANAGVQSVPSKPMRLRWKQTPSSPAHETISPPVTPREDDLRVVPSVYSETLSTWLLIEQAKTAIASQDSVHFDRFLRDLDTAGTTLEALQAPMREFCTPEEPYIPFVAVAAQHSASAIIECLVKSGLDVSTEDDFGRTALHHAKDDRTIHALIDAGADVNAGQSSWTDWSTPLYIAVQDGDVSRAATLLSAGARVGRWSVCGSTSTLCNAIHKRDNAMFECLLPAAHGEGISLDAIYVEVIRRGTAIMTSYMLEHGADAQLVLIEHPDLTQGLFSRIVGHKVEDEDLVTYPDAAEKVQILNLGAPAIHALGPLAGDEQSAVYASPTSPGLHAGGGSTEVEHDRRTVSFSVMEVLSDVDRATAEWRLTTEGDSTGMVAVAPARSVSPALAEQSERMDPGSSTFGPYEGSTKTERQLFLSDAPTRRASTAITSSPASGGSSLGFPRPLDSSQGELMHPPRVQQTQADAQQATGTVPESDTAWHTEYDSQPQDHPAHDDYLLVINALSDCGFELSSHPSNLRNHLLCLLPIAKTAAKGDEGAVIALIRRKLGSSIMEHQTRIIAGYRCLMSLGWDIHQGAPSWDALQHAVWEEQDLVVEWLLNHGAVVENAVEGSTPLVMAASRGLRSVVSLLLSHGANANGHGISHGSSALTGALRSQDGHIVRALLDADAKIFLGDDENEIMRLYDLGRKEEPASVVAPLHATQDQRTHVNAQQDASLSRHDPLRPTRLGLACTIHAILALDSWRYPCCKRGVVLSKPREDLIQWLQDLKVLRGERNILRDLHKALVNPSRLSGANIMLVYQCLVQSGWDIHRKVDEWNLLHFAVYHARTEVVRWVLDQGAEVNGLTDDDPPRSPLALAACFYHACRYRHAYHASTARLLLSRDANPNGSLGVWDPMSRELLPLEAAVAEKDFAFVRLLLEAGAKIYPSHDEEEISRLYHAARGERPTDSFRITSRASHDREAVSHVHKMITTPTPRSPSPAALSPVDCRLEARSPLVSVQAYHDRVYNDFEHGPLYRDPGAPKPTADSEPLLPPSAVTGYPSLTQMAFDHMVQGCERRERRNRWKDWRNSQKLEI